MNEHDESIPESSEDAATSAASDAASPPAVKTVETWADELGTPAWLFAGARIGLGWPIGFELTEKAYREALDVAANVVCR